MGGGRGRGKEVASDGRQRDIIVVLCDISKARDVILPSRQSPAATPVTASLDPPRAPRRRGRRGRGRGGGEGGERERDGEVEEKEGRGRCGEGGEREGEGGVEEKQGKGESERERVRVCVCEREEMRYK